MAASRGLKNQLAQLDFTQNQAKVYEALITTGESRAGDLIVKTGLHRNTVYRALQQLERMHLLYVVMQGGVALYRPMSARALVDEYKRKEEYAREVVREVETMHSGSTETQILTGDQGIREYIPMLFGTHNVYTIGAEFRLLKTYAEECEKLDTARRKAGFKTYILAHPQYSIKEFMMQSTETRYLPKEFPRSPLIIDIFDDTVAQFVWSDPAIIVLIKNKNIAEAYMQYFNVLWEQARIRNKLLS